MDLIDRPDQRGMQIGIDIAYVLDDANLIPVPGKEGNELFVIHAAEDGALADLETVDVQYGQDRAGLSRVEVFDRVP